MHSSAIPNRTASANPDPAAGIATGVAGVSLYRLKSRFQSLLRPIAARLACWGVTANQITIAAMLGSILIGLSLVWAICGLDGGGRPIGAVALLLPVWLLVRMALNAIDGMLAREHGQKSALGAYLNELGDAVSDTALILPLAAIPPFEPSSVVAVALAALVSEMAGAIGPMVGAPRGYAGPMGKSDRALMLGGLGLWIGFAGLGWLPALPAWIAYLMPVAAALIVLTAINRVRAGIRCATPPVTRPNV